MGSVVPWTRFLALIEPHYPKVGPKCDRTQLPLETMLRVYFLQSAYVHTGREAAFTKDDDTFRGVTRKAPKGGELDELDEQINRIIAKVRARIEHPLRILKHQFGHAKTRYRGLAKNCAHLFTLGHLLLMRRRRTE